MVLASFFLSQPVSAQVVFNEIMYDLTGTDTGREWVEIMNTGNAAATVATSTWKFFEANTNHSLSLFQGSLSIPSGGFAIIVDDPSKFLLDWPGFSGTIFDSSFSLSNTGETIGLKSSTTTIVDQVTYASSTGASGDGNSLQRVGSIWRALFPTPGLANPSGSGTGSSATSSSQTVSVSATTTDNATPSTENSVSISYNNNSNWPIDPQIFSRIVGPTTAIAGADIILKGEAVGLENKPLENPRYVWNFGDGATKEGEAVFHAYNFPGDYVVILDVSSGKFNTSSRLRMKIIPADIVMSGIVSGPDGKVELSNNSNQELDLSWWRLRSGNQFFTLPKNTKILAHGTLPLSSAVTGLNLNPQDVALLYPNGVIAYQPPAAPIAAAPALKAQASVNDGVPATSPPVLSSEKTSHTIAATVEPPLSSQVAAVAEAFNEPGSVDKISQPVEKDTEKSSSIWLYGALGVIILGIGFVLLPKAARPKNPADDYEIIE